MTTLTNAAILLAARDIEVTCGGCRMLAQPARVVGIVARIIEDRHSGSSALGRAMTAAALKGDDLAWMAEAAAAHEQAVIRHVTAVVEYRCRTPECEIGVGPGVSCEVPL